MTHVVGKASPVSLTSGCMYWLRGSLTLYPSPSQQPLLCPLQASLFIMLLLLSQLEGDFLRRTFPIHLEEAKFPSTPKRQNSHPPWRVQTPNHPEEDKLPNHPEEDKFPSNENLRHCTHLPISTGHNPVLYLCVWPFIWYLNPKQAGCHLWIPKVYYGSWHRVVIHRVNEWLKKTSLESLLAAIF